LVTDISHQLKTPVSALKTCFDMYLQSDSEKEKAEFLNRSLVQMDKLESLISSLVNISRLESSMITLQKEKCLISEILIGAVDSVYHKAFQKGILLETFDFDDCGLTLDKKWTIEAIANILDNSIKYSPANSKIQITLTKLYSFLRIEISDEGIGIPKDEKNLIFKRFYRGNSAIVKENDGSGVGLYLTRKILEDQGGTISVTDNNPVGSIFIIQLPF
jgi:signal transduction histidine kinase